MVSSIVTPSSVGQPNNERAMIAANCWKTKKTKRTTIAQDAFQRESRPCDHAIAAAASALAIQERPAVEHKVGCFMSESSGTSIPHQLHQDAIKE